MTPQRGKVWLVGAGPGDPGLLTQKGARVLAHADAVVYDRLVSAPVLALAPPDCERIDVGKESGAHTVPQEEITALLVRLAQAGKAVVRLKGGDPFVFGRGGEEAAGLHEASVPFEIVPGVTSAVAAPAYAGIPLTHREHNAAFTVATGHEDPTKAASVLDYAALARGGQTLVLLMAMGELRNIVQRLLDHGMKPDTPVAVVRDGTGPRQQTIVATVATIVDEVERVRIRPPAVVVIGDVVRERERLRWFDRGPLFGKRVLVTRPAEAGDAFARGLRGLGAEPVLAPVIELRPPDDRAAAEDAARRVRDYAWVAFTSGAGVATFFACLRRAGTDARAFGDTRIAAIGTGTAERLRSYGIEPNYVPRSFVGEALATGLIERTERGDRVLVFRAQDARDVLPDALRAQWRDVDVVAAYKSVPVNDPRIAELAEATDVWTFTSAGIVRAFLANVPGAETIAGERTIACIGPITAEAAREAGLDVDVVAEEYTADGLLSALERSRI